MEAAMTFPKDGYHLGPTEGDPWWFLDVRMTVKAGAAESGDGLTLIEFSAPTGFGPPRHVHEREDEVFYVLDGAMRVVCGAKEWEAVPGSTVFLPRGIEHAFMVTSETPIRGLQITTPAGFEDFVAELGRPAEGPGLPPPTVPDIAHLDQVGRRTGRPSVGPPLTR
jgi:quercetin dioxygenase-like cupin family protein